MIGLPLAAGTGFTFADTFPIGLLFVGIAVFAAVGAMSHEHERAFSASLIYLGLGALAALAITRQPAATNEITTAAPRPPVPPLMSAVAMPRMQISPAANSQRTSCSVVMEYRM